MNETNEKVKGAVEPPNGHGGYATVMNGRVTGYYKYYETAKARTGGGIVVRAEDVQKYGYVR